MNGVMVKTCDTYKDLGVFITTELSFSSHYDYITSQVYRMLGLIRPTFTTKTIVQENKSL